MNDQQGVTVAIDADTTAFDAALRAASESTKNFGNVFTSTIRGAIVSGKSFEDTLRTMALQISTMSLNSALEPIENSISSLMNGVLSSILTPSPTGFSKGGAFGASGPVPFAKGGVVTSPALFSFAGGTGVMGEAGAEAVMPLKRGPDGKLGISGAAQSHPVSIVFNVQANDAESFRRSQGQVTSMLARAVRKGQKNL